MIIIKVLHLRKELPNVEIGLHYLMIINLLHNEEEAICLRVEDEDRFGAFCGEYFLVLNGRNKHFILDNKAHRLLCFLKH